MHIDSDEAALQQDVQILELIGTFKEYAAARAQALIDSFHIHGQFEKETCNPTRFPMGRNKIPNMIHDGIIYRFACNYNGMAFLCFTCVENHRRARFKTKTYTK